MRRDEPRVPGVGPGSAPGVRPRSRAVSPPPHQGALSPRWRSRRVRRIAAERSLGVGRLCPRPPVRTPTRTGPTDTDRNPVKETPQPEPGLAPSPRPVTDPPGLDAAPVIHQISVRRLGDVVAATVRTRVGGLAEVIPAVTALVVFDSGRLEQRRERLANAHGRHPAAGADRAALATGTILHGLS